MFGIKEKSLLTSARFDEKNSCVLQNSRRGLWCFWEYMERHQMRTKIQEFEGHWISQALRWVLDLLGYNSNFEILGVSGTRAEIDWGGWVLYTIVQWEEEKD